MTALVDFARYVRPEVPMCPEIQILDAILHAGIEFCRRTKIAQDTVDLTTVVGQQSYDISTLLATGFEPNEIIAVRRTGAENLEPTSQVDALEELELTESGTPRFYYMMGRIVSMVPAPDAIETLEVTLAIKPSESATTLPDELYRRYREEIAAGAKARLMLQAAQPWANAQVGSLHKFTFEAAINAENVSYAKGGGTKPLRTVINRF